MALLFLIFFEYAANGKNGEYEAVVRKTITIRKDEGQKRKK